MEPVSNIYTWNTVLWNLFLISIPGIQSPVEPVSNIYTWNTVLWNLYLPLGAQYCSSRHGGVLEHPAKGALVGRVGLVGVYQGVGWE